MKKYKANLDTFKIIKEPTDIPRAKITCSKDSYEYSKQFYHEDIEIYESMFLILLNRNNITTGYVKISQGGVAGTAIDTKIIAKYAIDNLASGAIIVHNHPSGNLTPSSADIEVSKKTKNALKLIDCILLDSLIITNTDSIITTKNYTSLADDGLL